MGRYLPEISDLRCEGSRQLPEVRTDVRRGTRDPIRKRCGLQYMARRLIKTLTQPVSLCGGGDTGCGGFYILGLSAGGASRATLHRSSQSVGAEVLQHMSGEALLPTDKIDVPSIPAARADREPVVQTAKSGPLLPPRGSSSSGVLRQEGWPSALQRQIISAGKRPEEGMRVAE